MMKSRLKLFFLLTAATAVFTRTNSLQKVDAQTAAAQTAADPRFGAIEAFWAPAEAAELGVGWERILFYWNEIQPTGPEDWNTLHVLEEWLVEANGNGRTILGLLKNTPVWATDGEPFSGVPRGLYLPINDPGNLWANYVRQVARYYGPRGVHNWIVWNEPDIAAGVYGYEFSGSTGDYYRLVKVAYLAIKQVDPSATIHLGGMTFWHDPGFLRRYLGIAMADPDAAENNYYFDVISLHIYFRPETMQFIIGNAYAAQTELGVDPLKPVWVNETNARANEDPEWPVNVELFSLDLEQQAWYIPQAYALGFYAGARRMSVYKLVDVNIAPGEESWGLIRPYDFSKRPAYFAYKNTINYLSDFTYPIRREQGDNHFIVSFSRPQGLTRVLWARFADPVPLLVPALAESAQLVDVLGELTPITADNGFYAITLEGARCDGECIIGGPPLFLVEDGVTANQIPPSELLPTLTPPPTNTPTAVPTATQRPSVTPSPRPTNTPEPTLTATATDTTLPAPIETAVALTTMTEETTTAIPIPSTLPAGAMEPPQSTSIGYWFLGAAGFVALLLTAILVKRRG